MSNSGKILITTFVTFVIFGIIDGVVPSAIQLTPIIHGVILAVLIFNWVGIHAKENQKKVSLGAKTASGLLPPIGVPYYFFSSFGLKQGVSKLMLSILFLISAQSFYVLLVYLLGNIT